MTDEEIVFLDQDQKKAVEYNQGPLLIVAGAGTGKTFVIVEKIKYLIKKNLAKPAEFLALTFTEKAAYEMEERVDKSLPYGYFQMWISTFHAFADQILKEESAAIGLNPAFKIMTEAESIIFLKKNLFLFNLKYFRPLGNPNKFLSALLNHFSRLQDEDITPDQYINWAQNQNLKLKTQNQEEKIEIEKYLELAHAYKKYLNLKIKEGVMDFSDLIYYLLRLLRQRPNILKKYQNQFKYVLVDEFQDTNIAQYELIKLLCPPQKKPKLTVVGDDSQSIYKFRGASVSNILNFMEDYPDAKQIVLINNYRSHQTILNHAYQLIQNNNPDTLEAKLGISKNLRAQKEDDKNSVQIFLAERVEEEADFVVKKILQLKSDYRYQDFAILVRANNHVEPFIKALTRAGIPYQFLGPGMLFKQPEIKDLIAYLKILTDLEDSPSFYRLLSMDLFNIDQKDIHLLLAFAKKTTLPLFQATEILLSFYYQELAQEEFLIYKNLLPFIKKETRDKLFQLYSMINNHLKKTKSYTAGQILYWFLEDTGYLSKLIDFKTEKEEKIALNISKFFDRLKTYEADHEDASVQAIVDYIQMSMELKESPIVSKTDLSADNAVNILTVHSAKGLEFKVVFIVNLSQGRFPNYEKKEAIPIPQSLIKEILPQGDYHQQEERRLFYVGLTRATDKVFLSASQYYQGGKRIRKVSPFVIETLGQPAVNRILALKKEEKTQLSIFDFKPIKQQKTSLSEKKQTFLPNQFSFTQLQTFKTCPLQYKYQYVLKIPTTPGAAESFGTTIHRTLEKFYKQYLSNNNIGLKQLLTIYKENWLPLGFASSVHAQRMKKEGEKMLTEYFKKFHSPQLKIISLEKLFKIKLDDLIITGKIDRVDLLSKNEIEIIDYKTGKKPSEKELKKNLQFSIYALAAADKGLFNKKLDEINLSFYYLQTQEKITIKKTEEELKDARKQIKTLVSQIKENQFFPEIGPWCDFCPFKMICEAWQ